MRAAVCIALFAVLVAGQTAQNPEQLFRAAVEAQQHGDYSTAIRKYRLLLKTHPNSPDVLANLGAALVHEKQFDQGIASYQAALKLVPHNTAIQMNLALALYKKDDFRDAARGFAALRKEKPENARIATLLADCYVQLGQASQATALLKPLAAAQPGDLDMAYVLGLAFIDSGRRQKGAVLVERVAQQRNNPHAYLLAGSTWLDLNAFQKAKKDLETALSMDPSLPRIHTLVGLARDDLGDIKGAEPEFRQALAENPDDFRANLTLGAELYRQRHLAEARKYLEHAVALKPSSAVACYELGLVKRADGDFAAAAVDLQAAVKEKPEWLDPHVALAALYYKLHRPADGLKQRQIVQRLMAKQQQQGPQ